MKDPRRCVTDTGKLIDLDIPTESLLGIDFLDRSTRPLEHRFGLHTKRSDRLFAASRPWSCVSHWVICVRRASFSAFNIYYWTWSCSSFRERVSFFVECIFQDLALGLLFIVPGKPTVLRCNHRFGFGIMLDSLLRMGVS